MIKNTPAKTNERCELLRDAVEHRALWGGLLIAEAKKRGIGIDFAHEAVKRCGVFHGNNKYTKTNDLKSFADEFANADVRDVFEMEIMECTDDRFSVHFHYCPLVAAWMKLGFSETELPELCDVAMDGDRGIIDTFPDFRFELGQTIAQGHDICEIAITRTSEALKESDRRHAE
jgi:hypothetical protein